MKNAYYTYSKDKTLYYYVKNRRICTFSLKEGLKLNNLKSSQTIVQFDENGIKKMPIYRFDVKNEFFLKKVARNY